MDLVRYFVNPLSWSDLLLSIFSGLFTGLILLVYSGYRDRIRAKYCSKATVLQHISNQISNAIKWDIFEKHQCENNELSVSMQRSWAENVNPITETDRVCKIIIELNGNDDIVWLNNKSKYAQELYTKLIVKACVMQSRMGTVIITPVINRNEDKNIDKQEL